MKKELARLKEENASLRRANESLVTLTGGLKREMLQERMWRIRFQIDHLSTSLRQAEAELAELEKQSGNQAEDPLQDQG